MRPKAAFLLLVLALTATACSMVRGSGEVVTIEIPVDDFSRLEVSHAFDVNVTVGEEPALTLRIDDNLEASLSVGVSDDTLRIGLGPRTAISNATLEADVTMTSLEAIEGSEAIALTMGAQRFLDQITGMRGEGRKAATSSSRG